MGGAAGVAMDRAAVSKRIADENGWYEVRDNPLSKTGVFPYLGATLPNAPDPNRVYRVYRPADELADPQFLDSLRLIPFVDDHEMLGDEAEGLTPAEQYGVHGVIGENVYFDGAYVRGNIKVFSQAIASAIEHHKRELSLGYRCEYEWSPGEYQGIPYDAIQRRLRGNHLALVQEGRMGKDVAVLDHQTFTIDSLEYMTMADENEGEGGGELTLEQVEQMLPRLAQFVEKLGALTGKPATPPAEGGEGDGKPPAAAPPAANAGAEGGGTEPPTGEGAAKQMAVTVDRLASMDASLRKIAAALDSIKAAKPAAAVDAAELARSVAADAADARALATRLEPFVGVFDHARMNHADVVKYGCDKLGLKPAAGQERTAVEAYLHGREAPKPIRAATAADAAPGGAVAKYIAGNDGAKKE